MKIYIRLAKSIPFILLALTLGCSSRQRTQKEAILKQYLSTIRSTIDQYTEDKGQAPQHLGNLVTAGYLRSIPQDPFTGAPNWVEVQEDAASRADRNRPGISDVHSASNLISSEGTRYDSW